MARAAKHSKAVVEEPVSAPSVAAPVVAKPAAAKPVIAKPVAAEPVVAPVENVVVAKVVKSVSREEIAKLAYCYWADRGYQGGNPQEDWVRAEQTLLALAAQ